MLKKAAYAIVAVLAVCSLLLAVVLVKPDWFRGTAGWVVAQTTDLQLRLDHIESHLHPFRFDIRGLALDSDGRSLLQVEQAQLQLFDNPFRGKPFWNLNASGIALQPPAAAPAAEAAEEEGEEIASAPELPADFSFGAVVLKDITVELPAAEQPPLTLQVHEVRLERRRPAVAALTSRFTLNDEVFTTEATLQLPEAGNTDLRYRLQLKHPDLAFSSDGTLQMQADFTSGDIDTALAVASLQFAERLSGNDLPDFQDLALSGHLLISRERVQVDALELAVGENRVTGNVTVALKSPLQISAEFSSETLDVDALLAALSQDTDDSEEPEADDDRLSLPEQFTLDARWQLAAVTSGGWQARDLKLQARLDRHLEISANIADLLGPEQRSRIANLTATAVLEPLAADAGAADLRLSLAAHNDILTVKSEGTVNTAGSAGTALELTASADRSDALWQLLALPYSEAGAWQLSGALNGSETQWHNTLNLKLGEQTLRADSTWTVGAPPKLTSSIEASRLDLAFLQAADATAPSDEDSDDGRVISADKIDFAVLKRFNGGVDILVTDVRTPYDHIRRAQLKPMLRDGVLTLENGRVDFDHGSLALALRVDARPAAAEVAVDATLESTDYSRLGLAQFVDATGGNGSVTVHLRAAGDSPRALAAALSGSAGLTVSDLVANNTSLDLLGSDLLTETFQMLNPFVKQDPNTHFECLSVHFDGENGKFVSDRNIDIETSKMKIVGTGHIDFANETLSLGFTPIARKGLGVNLGNLASLVRLGGTFRHPEPVADASGVLTTTLTTGAAVYTGGLSLVAKSLIDRALNSGSACKPDAEPVEYLVPLEAPPEPASGDADSDDAAAGESRRSLQKGPVSPQ